MHMCVKEKKFIILIDTHRIYVKEFKTCKHSFVFVLKQSFFFGSLHLKVDVLHKKISLCSDNKKNVFVVAYHRQGREGPFSYWKVCSFVIIIFIFYFFSRKTKN